MRARNLLRAAHVCNQKFFGSRERDEVAFFFIQNQNIKAACGRRTNLRTENSNMERDGYLCGFSAFLFIAKTS